MRTGPNIHRIHCSNNVPTECMIGSGIASSLVHEVGHQVSALLDLHGILRPMPAGLDGKQTKWLVNAMIPREQVKTEGGNFCCIVNFSGQALIDGFK